EGVQEDPPVLAPVAQPVEHRQSVAVAGHRLPVEQERSALQGAGGLEDQRKASRPVDPVAGEQAHAGGVPTDHYSEAVVLDLMNPAGAGRRTLAGARAP